MRIRQKNVLSEVSNDNLNWCGLGSFLEIEIDYSADW
jgi:hypothetical protein